MGGVDEISQILGRLQASADQSRRNADALFELVGDLQGKQAQLTSDVHALTENVKKLTDVVSVHEKLSVQAGVLSWIWKGLWGLICAAAGALASHHWS